VQKIVRTIPYLKLPILLWILFVSLVFTLSGFAAELNGNVTNVIRERVVILLNGDKIPAIGDMVTLFLEHEALGEMSIGTWKVTKVEYPNVHASKMNATGDAKVGVKAVIQTLNPEPANVKKKTEKIARPDPAKGPVDESLIAASEKGSLSGVRQAIKNGANLDAARNSGDFALAAAILGGHYSVVEALLKAGAYPDLEDVKGRTALGLAAIKGKNDIIRLLVKNGANINYKNHAKGGWFPGATPLSIAAKMKQLKTTELLFSMGADPLLEDNLGRNALGYAIESRDLDIVIIFLNRGVSLDPSISTGLSPLHIAVEQSGSWQMFAYLIGAGADMNARIKQTATMPKEIHGATPLIFLTGQTPGDDVVEAALLLLLAGADPFIKTTRGNTALDEIRITKKILETKKAEGDSNGYYLKRAIQIEKVLKDPVWIKKEGKKFFQNKLADAVEDNDINSLMALDAIGFDLGQALKNQDPLLGETIAEGRFKMARLLLKYGANPVGEDEDGRTPFLAAIYKERLDLAKLLFEKGALPNDLPWGIPLGTLQFVYDHVKEKRIELIEYLISIGADPNWRNEEYNTPLHIAAQKGDAWFFELLIENGANPRLQNKEKKRAIELVPSSKKETFNRIQNKVWPPTSIIVRTIEHLETILLKAKNNKDWDLYKKMANQLMEQGDPKGFWAMGMVYSKGRGVGINHKKAFDYFRQGSNIEIGDRDLYYYLGLYHETGPGGVKKDHKKAVFWYEKAIKKGSLEASYRLGKMVLNGLGVKKDPYRAFVLIKSSAIQGRESAEAIHWVGYLYENGIGTLKSIKKAERLYEAAKERGFEKEKDTYSAPFHLCDELAGDPYDDQRIGPIVGYGDIDASKAVSACEEAVGKYPETPRFLFQLARAYTKDKQYKKAKQYYLQAIDRGSAAAMNNLGALYDQGWGVPKDPVKAYKWYRASVDKGNSLALYNMGSMYRNGNQVPKDITKALKWYKKSAAKGNDLAQNTLGYIYDHGKGVPKNDQEAVKWYRKGAEAGNWGAQKNLGRMYYVGEGVKKDYVEAAKWYRKAAEQGNLSSQERLGVMYALGKGVKKDYVEAVKWFRKAAEKGHAGGQLNLGTMYYNGDGVPEDNAKALKWYRLSAEQGSSIAQKKIGVMYEKGYGVTKNIETAIKWYKKAAAQDNEKAKKALKRLNAN